MFDLKLFENPNVPVTINLGHGQSWKVTLQMIGIVLVAFSLFLIVVFESHNFVKTIGMGLLVASVALLALSQKNRKA